MEKSLQSCPVCDGTVKTIQRYPRYLCRECGGRVVDIAGRKVYFTNLSVNSDALVMHFADSAIPDVVIDDPWTSEFAKVWVDGRECEVRAAHFGGVVIQTAD
jgi:hypothetical protein